MRAQLVRENIEFQRTGDTKSSLNVGEKRDQIPWDKLDELPRGKVYKVLAKNPDDEAFIFIGRSRRIYVIKKWESNGGEWSDSWTNYQDIIDLSFEEWLKENNAYKLIPYEIVKHHEINLNGLKPI